MASDIEIKSKFDPLLGVVFQHLQGKKGILMSFFDVFYNQLKCQYLDILRSFGLIQ